jgi:hypothetical protein
MFYSLNPVVFCVDWSNLFDIPRPSCGTAPIASLRDATTKQQKTQRLNQSAGSSFAKISTAAANSPPTQTSTLI